MAIVFNSKRILADVLIGRAVIDKRQIIEVIKALGYEYHTKRSKETGGREVYRHDHYGEIVLPKRDQTNKEEVLPIQREFTRMKNDNYEPFVQIQNAKTEAQIARQKRRTAARNVRSQQTESPEEQGR